MKDVFHKSEYSFSIEPITDEDRMTLTENRKFSIKYAVLCCAIFTFIIAVALLPFGFSKDDLEADCIVIIILLLVELLIIGIMYLDEKAAHKSIYKIVEEGVVTKQETVLDDTGETKYTYIGTESFTYVPVNIKVGDRISIEHTLNKKSRKKHFVRVRKI